MFNSIMEHIQGGAFLCSWEDDSVPRVLSAPQECSLSQREILLSFSVWRPTICFSVSPHYCQISKYDNF